MPPRGEMTRIWPHDGHGRRYARSSGGYDVPPRIPPDSAPICAGATSPGPNYKRKCRAVKSNFQTCAQYDIECSNSLLLWRVSGSQGPARWDVAPEMAVNRLAQEWREPAPSPVEVSIVMPCLNEAATLASCIRKAQAAIAKGGLAAEIIVADNGSTDASPTIARALGARLVAAEPRGYGAALQAGIAAARGQYVVMG